MRKLIGTIFFLCLCVGVCSAEEDLYTIIDGKIIAKPEYVDTLLGRKKLVDMESIDRYTET